MSNTVRVEIRGVQLAEAVPIETSDSGVFIPLDDPPPVRSVLALFDGDEAPRALEVTSVVEVPAEGGSRGLLGRFVESDALARFERVGTEHLADGEVSTAEGDEDESGEGGDDALGVQMAMPAPVVVDLDESEPLDVAESPGAVANAQAEDEEPDAEAASDASDQEASASEDEGESPRKGKRRRGRKRK